MAENYFSKLAEASKVTFDQGGTYNPSQAALVQALKAQDEAQRAEQESGASSQNKSSSTGTSQGTYGPGVHSYTALEDARQTAQEQSILNNFEYRNGRLINKLLNIDMTDSTIAPARRAREVLAKHGITPYSSATSQEAVDQGIADGSVPALDTQLNPVLGLNMQSALAQLQPQQAEAETSKQGDNPSLAGVQPTSSFGFKNASNDAAGLTLDTIGQSFINRKEGLTNEEYMNLRDDLVSVTQNLTDSFTKTGSALGGSLEDISYAFNAHNKSADSVAKDIGDAYDMDSNQRMAIKGKIAELQKKYSELPPSAIGTVLKKHLRPHNDDYWIFDNGDRIHDNGQEGSDDEKWKETALYVDDEDDVLADLNSLKDPKSTVNYDALRAEHSRLQKTFNKIKGVETAFLNNEQAIQAQMNEATAWGADPSKYTKYQQYMSGLSAKRNRESSEVLLNQLGALYNTLAKEYKL